MKNSEKISFAAIINGNAREAKVHSMERLLDVLREEFHLTGTKEGCGEGECGACSVFINGKLVNSCLVPAAQANGKTITTIEGVASDKLHPLQESFLKNGGAQCGMCTPGMVMAALDLINTVEKPTHGQIREALAGNLCRCTGYTKIIDSVYEAAHQEEKCHAGERSSV